MAANIPAKLKQAGITPFIVRANQLESAKPVISYWCHYWVVNQILAKQLHNTDHECLNFTTALMDKLEQTKSQHAGNDAILDDVAGQAYVEQFAQETFERALRPLKANKVTQQTASTFEAAATFLQLVNIWGQPDPETQEKIKYSKWNAARILKAIKEGKDPNESNPRQEEEKPEQALDLNGPEVQMIDSSQPRPATVEDVPDDETRSQTAPSRYSLHAPAPVSAPTSPLPPTAPVPEQVSPMAPPDAPTSDPESYFPSAPQSTDHGPLDLPSTSSMPPPGSGGYDSAPSPPLVIPSPSTHDPSMPPPAPQVPLNLPSTPQDFYRSHPPPASAPTPPVAPSQRPYAPPQAPPAVQNYYSQPSQPVAPQVAPAPVQPAQQYGGSGGPSNSHTIDDRTIAEAQKHAKWAISALNFEDVPTAVRELHAALASCCLHERGPICTYDLSRDPTALGPCHESNQARDLFGGAQAVKGALRGDTLDQGLRLALHEQVGRRRPQRHGVDGDALPAQVLGQHARQLLDAPLVEAYSAYGGGTALLRVMPVETKMMRPPDDMCGSAFCARKNGPLTLRSGCMGMIPRVGHQHVDAPELGHHRVDECLDRRDFRHVGLDGQGPVGPNLRDDFVGGGAVSAVVDDDAGAGCGDAVGDGAADALGAAGDENDLSLERRRHVRYVVFVVCGDCWNLIGSRIDLIVIIATAGLGVEQKKTPGWRFGFDSPGFFQIRAGPPRSEELHACRIIPSDSTSNCRHPSVGFTALHTLHGESDPRSIYLRNLVHIGLPKYRQKNTGRITDTGFTMYKYHRHVIRLITRKTTCNITYNIKLSLTFTNNHHTMSSTSLPKTYKVACLEKAGEPITIKDVDLKQPEPGQVLVKVLACGVCHSDLFVQGGHLGDVFPRVPGHELIGDVVAVGSSVTRFKGGERVGGPWHGGHDKTCRSCARGQFQMCDNAAINGVSRDGGYAEYVLLREEAVVRVPKDIDAAEAAPLLCAGVTVFNSMRKMHIEQGNTVAIQGVGGLGHLAVQYANKMGYHVVAISSGDSKKDFATKLGAHVYIDSSKDDPVKQLRALGGAAMIVATAPNPKALSPLVGGLQAGGKLIVLAPIGPVEFDTVTLVNRGASVHGWPSGHALDSEEAIRFSQDHGVKCMIEKFPLADAAKAMEHCGSGKVRFRAVLTM
ncbi:Uu.00g036220.m01.CDS01 [Anthostomella pinea]|uniref:Uu.00g036220.m01.CDS01 n=1 Tax=Anthostomella pinea TaxID=933095 RepID=A0AAI8V993_9PEZI|nr:Uu.00g036220.m01.CDS01 [Anthostomella pinea]